MVHAYIVNERSTSFKIKGIHYFVVMDKYFEW